MEKQFKIYLGKIYFVLLCRGLCGQVSLGNAGLDKVKLLWAFQDLGYAVVWFQTLRRACILYAISLIYFYVDFFF